MKNTLKIFFELTKIRITLFVMLTTAFGYIAASSQIDIRIIPVLIGVLLLAFGSAALNHYQEKDFDSKMNRTNKRPIPSGRISPVNVLIVSTGLVIIGSVILIVFTDFLVLSLGLLNLVWYNFFYTLLKRKTPFAIIPGSFVGAIPPVIGWVAAGGSMSDPQMIIIAFFFFIWQIPHFWLLLLVMDDDYKRAGFPTLSMLFNKAQLSRITFIWIISTVVTGLMIPLFGIVTQLWIDIALFISGMLLTWRAFGLLAESNDFSEFRLNFRSINYFALSVVFFVSIDKLIS
ncbi:MAG: protoheme IX farnesyltransferase [Ignavibacteriota bacterium]|nr:protoheme IX farnesyltransferase [Ignavibacteriales bacterium]MBL1121562.1 protoheme IX farnesyltransferase [Ignavibacteriota bacterium]MCE7855234.1 protoheme IX farnesyltransferase [Ignavibacteria bacterium CHB3]NUM61349.1 protoheme IX farnesyltransferase [Ignavibacteriaceae bacterium]QKJ97253.1 MAG: protoheme IX farnesyltransferase [Ignavibacteriota bacterium]